MLTKISFMKVPLYLSMMALIMFNMYIKSEIPKLTHSKDGIRASKFNKSSAVAETSDHARAKWLL